MTAKNAGSLTLRQKLVAKAETFIREKVPAHTRAEYEQLLAFNTDLALELITKWQALEELREAYDRLQTEYAESIPSPHIQVTGQSYTMPQEMARVHTLQWDMEPFRANVHLPDQNRALRYDVLPELQGAFKEMYHRKFVPALWKKTEAALFELASHAAAYR